MRRLALLTFVAIMLSACHNTPSFSPTPTFIYVLVDLSQTWNNESAMERNHALLTEVGSGLADAATQGLDTPVYVQFRPIGVNSLGRAPLCDVAFTPTILASSKRRPAYMVSDPKKLASLLGGDCPLLVSHQQPEALTEISAAIASIASDEPVSTKTDTSQRLHHTLIILSDFKEETQAGPTPLPDLTDYRILLIYRPVSPDDHLHPNALQSRMQDWFNRLQGRGARVTMMSDTGMKRATINDFVSAEEPAGKAS